MEKHHEFKASLGYIQKSLKAAWVNNTRFNNILVKSGLFKRDRDRNTDKQKD